MKYRKLGRTNWNVSEIGYGMWGMAGWTGSDDEESFNSLQLAADMGCNFFDTAWGYGAGKSESLLGQLIRANKGKKLFTATKIPPKNLKWPARPEYTLDDCYPPDHIEEYVEKSLKNAGLSFFDIMQFHTWDDGWMKDDRGLKKMVELKEQGLFHAIGISMNRWEPWNGIKAVKTGLIDTVQVIYNIFDQNPKDELFPACREMNVGVIARVPFDEGSLTGTLTKDSRWPEGDWRNTYFVTENLNSSVDHADALKPLVPEGMTMSEMALRFILGEPTVSTIIPGMRKPKHAMINMAASDAGPLAPDLMKELEKHRWDRKPKPWSQ
ncbi:MAG: aldo/keto reductase [Bacteroidetes bacterium RBG_13_43_22]|nr:MAG: aldo/keto reductase [Bacteroidetes bacterium RBG_13_43_22]